MMEIKNIGKDAALVKAKSFCAYQERNHYEVKEKLYSYGLYKHDVEEIMSVLIEENYLNEERFAVAFAQGHFRMKGWGKVKIKYELKKKGVSDYCIKKGLNGINEEDYSATLTKIFEQKLKDVRSEKNIFRKKAKVRSFLLQRGFEAEFVGEMINKIGA